MWNNPQAQIEIGIRIPIYRYAREIVLSSIELRLVAPALVALLGPNGSGKSTLLKLMGGLLPARESTIEADRVDLARLSPRERARRIAWVPQRGETAFSMSVREMVRIGRYRVERPFRQLPAEEGDRIDAMLRRVGLSDLADREVTALSGGEWQRALIARALVQDAPILLLDEPVASLDLRYQEEVYQLLRGLVSEGRLVVVADHHLEIAATYADRILLLCEGRIVADGPAEEVVTAETITRVFGIETDVFRDPVTGSPRLSRPRGRG